MRGKSCAIIRFNGSHAGEQEVLHAIPVDLQGVGKKRKLLGHGRSWEEPFPTALHRQVSERHEPARRLGQELP